MKKFWILFQISGNKPYSSINAIQTPNVVRQVVLDAFYDMNSIYGDEFTLRESLDSQKISSTMASTMVSRRIEQSKWKVEK